MDMKAQKAIVTTKFDIDLIELEDAQQEDLEQLLELCHKHLDSVDDELITRAFKLCYQSHYGVTRASGEPYYYHPLEVAKITAVEISIDDISIAAALLHDTVEDTEITLDDIREMFNDELATIIDGVTKIEGVFFNRQSKQAEAYMKLLLTMVKDLRVVFIKFADRLHNMRTIRHLRKEKQIKIAHETMDLYAPLAHRFGLFKIKNELEDLCFKTIDPTSYKFIARKLREKKEAREAFVKEFMQPIKEQLEKENYKLEIKGRPKHIYSIYRKMQKQQKPIEQIYDLFAIRIILQEPHTKADCWYVYSTITNWYKPIPDRFRDFISLPKANGYQSLHTTVITNRGKRVEVQIRTQMMDEIAELGLAAHWKYKEGGQGSAILERFWSWLRDALENPRPDNAVDFVKDFQSNFYTDEIYVFTPNGDLITLPKGATAIDFAFNIHSEVGERAVSAKVNGQMIPLRQKLNTGETVEITTGNKINMNVDWIDDVVTHKAKSRIRQFIKQKQRRISDDGREQWIKRAERSKIEISDQELTIVAKHFKFDTTQSMFYSIGAGAFDVDKLYNEVKKFKSTGKVGAKNDKTASPKENEIQETFINAARAIGGGKPIVLNGGISDVKYSYANCCSPLPGDDVIGFVSRAGDIKIHRSMCNNAQHLIETDGDRIVDVNWAKNIETQFLGAVKVIGEDRVGLINDLTDVLSKSMSTNMKSINVSSDSGMFEGLISLYVNDLEHLAKIINRLERVEGVKTVFRYE